MENRIKNLAVEQMKSDNINEMYSKEPFFKEYSKVFCENKLFNKDIINAMQQGININHAIKLSDTLINKFEKKVNILSEIDAKISIGLIIFIGDGKIDGNSIILNNSTYVFIDLNAIISRSNQNYDLDAFLAHEIIHAAHYDLNKAFYPKNYNLIEDKYLKRLIGEGLATYMSILLFGISEELGYWVGFLKNDDIIQWIYNCESMKTSMGINLKVLISNKRFDKSLYDKLFCITKYEDFTFSRMGYYYGCEIIKKICNENSINEVFRLEFNDIKKYINAYFKIKIV
ncbi:DUF2268 domain-containing putative Zn-dependent protease (plasmid) [Clostridium estertheticum]|uniref:DUF2268 domain-containing putative Zn-dependent protease n=1 Tax=Clostridium estertheticum TaxID=238834 RepID=UPI001C0B8B9F|nr:DUF2268 domain-containing putative Zn-dependent protease [Clostridium estertheticum]MBU3201773.1 hypothetical protein [Clostridium estertheticum]WAG68168.1 DUF2268 domain-containing putative Zn-dependent protease [Clostridium estertheticum]